MYLKLQNTNQNPLLFDNSGTAVKNHKGPPNTQTKFFALSRASIICVEFLRPPFLQVSTGTLAGFPKMHRQRLAGGNRKRLSSKTPLFCLGMSALVFSFLQSLNKVISGLCQQLLDQKA